MQGLRASVMHEGPPRPPLKTLISLDVGSRGQRRTPHRNREAVPRHDALCEIGNPLRFSWAHNHFFDQIRKIRLNPKSRGCFLDVLFSVASHDRSKHYHLHVRTFVLP